MDIASIVGTILGFSMLIFGIVSSSGWGAIYDNFWDFPSFLITFGGSIFGTMASHKLPDFIAGFKSIRLAFQHKELDPGVVIHNIINLSNIARKEGLLALEEAANEIEDDFLKKGVMLVVDGTDPELVRGILETDLNCIEVRHKKTIGFWEKWAELGPAWGMIGTLIGLINMLTMLKMAGALVTTFYGSVIANWLCNPVATKLGVNNANEIMMKEVTVEGLLSIQAGENPRVIEEKLKSFLSPTARENLNGDKDGGEE